MSYRRGPNCLPTGDVEPRAEDLFLRGWNGERQKQMKGERFAGFSRNQNHDALCWHRFFLAKRRRPKLLVKEFR